MPDDPDLGPDFLFGAATASYQIEGAVEEDGRGPSAWDVFCAVPGNVLNDESGAVACDHYHRHAEDVAIMGDLGLDAYRFSIAWPRIQPDASGAVNAAGLDFYDRLVDELLAVGVEPSATLFHWDTPQWLEELGGWEERSIADRFGEYAAIVADRLADRVARWMTLNEPNIITLLGHAVGVHAPGKALGLGALDVAHHQLLAHGRAVQALRAADARQVGIAGNHAPIWPASDDADDVEAAHAYDLVYNRVFSDPVLAGRWPDESVVALMPDVEDDDLALIAQPLDWYGVNYYKPECVGAPGKHPSPPDALPLPDGLPFGFVDLDGYPRSDFGWVMVPEAFTELLVGLRDTYGAALPPLYVTENGTSMADGPGDDGRVRDARRTEYLRTHLHAVRAAKAAGVDVRGYFTWSLLDNFEWAAGYGQRFGLVHVDYATQRRTPKDSALWYRDLIAAHRA